MNKDILKGHWKEAKGKLKAKWGKLTDDSISAMEGNYEELSGKIQKAYGYNKEQADREIKDFLEKNQWRD